MKRLNRTVLNPRWWLVLPLLIASLPFFAAWGLIEVGTPKMRAVVAWVRAGAKP